MFIVVAYSTSLSIFRTGAGWSVFRKDAVPYKDKNAAQADVESIVKNNPDLASKCNFDIVTVS